jgi:catechol-2,3-dioxygenase
VNHIAFASSSLHDLAARRQRLLDHGHDVIEIDHGWCTSIYANDPNGTLVEFCCTTRRFTEADVEEAEQLVNAAQPPLGDTPPFKIHEAAKS